MPTDPEQMELALEGECQVEVFQKEEVRKVFHEKGWWFSVKDVLEVLTGTTDGNRYSRDLRAKDEGLKEGWAEITRALPFDSGKGGTQETTFISIEGIFRLMQSVPSKKAEPFKKWLAKVGFERVQEYHNPDLAIERAVAIYHAKGYPIEWIEARIPNKIARERLEEEWHKRGITQPVEFAVLTAAISEETFGITPAEHKEVKNLGKSHNLRDNMTPIELTLTTLAEQATREIAEATDAQNFYAHKAAAKSGGSIAGQARRDIESATGKEVVSKTNYLTERQRKNMELPENFDETLARIAQVKPPKEEK